MKTVIQVENLSKQYRLGQVGTGTISHDLNRWWHRVRGKEDPYLKIGESNDRSSKGSSEYVWALQDINFSVQQGEVLGIIGKNGAGKSTLLKILSKVTGPTTGSIKARGRIASLLEVGTGFHQELTGRENIYLNGTILGMTKAEVKSKLDEIVAFAGVERYLDTPVKRYSSGMMVRLGFAVAAHLEPEILIVDEVLAVGDAEFQKKAVGKMQEVSREGGRTVLFVSHNMGSVEALCTRGVLLRNGTIAYMGDTKDTIAEYLKRNAEEPISKIGNVTNRSGNGLVRFEDFWVENDKGEKNPIITTGSDVWLVFKVKIKEAVDRVDIGFSIHAPTDYMLSVLYSSYQGELFSFSGDNEYEVVRCKLPHISLAPGRLGIKGRILVSGLESDWPKEQVGYIDIEGGDFYGTGTLGFSGNTPVLIKGRWG